MNDHYLLALTHHLLHGLRLRSFVEAVLAGFVFLVFLLGHHDLLVHFKILFMGCEQEQLMNSITRIGSCLFPAKILCC